MELNTLTLHAINIGILTLLFFIAGMIKPKWPLFFMKNPNRWYVTAISTVFFMIFMTMYGEGRQQQKLKEKHMKKPAAAAAQAPVPVPVEVPVPTPTDKPKPAAKN